MVQLELARTQGCGASLHKCRVSQAPPAATTHSSSLFSSPALLPPDGGQLSPQESLLCWRAPPQDAPLCHCPLHARVSLHPKCQVLEGWQPQHH